MKQEYKLLVLLMVLLMLSAAVLGCGQSTSAELTATPGITEGTTATAGATDGTTASPDVTSSQTSPSASGTSLVTSTGSPSDTSAPTDSSSPTGSPAPTAAVPTPTLANSTLPFITPSPNPNPTKTPAPTATPAPTPQNTTATQWVMKELTFQSSKAYTTSANVKYQTGFEASTVPAGWYNFGGTGISVSTSVYHSGSRSLRLSGRQNAWDSLYFNVYDTLKSGGAGLYTVRFWVYIDSAASSSSGRVLVRGGSSADANSFITNNGGQYFSDISTATFTTPAKTWVEYTGSINVLASDITRSAGDFRVMLHTLAAVSGQNLYFDDFSIEKGAGSTAFGDTEMDVIFTGPGGATLTMPAFWDGGTTWKVRFAPTKTGAWTWRSVCSDTANTGLHNKTGTLTAGVYTGSLDIYKHGFVKTSSSLRYFTYADGTPFFYLGDTHWNMPATPFDTSEKAGISSTFKYQVDERVEQGFTVYQSEPLGAQYNLSNGLTDSDLAGFADLDRRFAYIAEKGLVHANAQLFFASELGYNISNYPDAYLEKLCRYWVARYGAYPVMWTTAQEVDNDFYYNASGDQHYFDATTNPWKKVIQWVYSFDPYKHPSTAHQENTGSTRASTSSFRDLSAHKWYGAQWSPAKNGQLDFSVPKDYWNNGQGKPVVNYEGHYHNLWTNEYGARMQGWTAFLNGMYGHGYGAIDIWLYNSTYDMANPSTVYGITITVADKSVKWYDSIHFASAYQMGYMHNFFDDLEWWNLQPWFDTSNKFTNNSSWYSIASQGDDVIVAYFYNNTNQNTGSFKNLTNGQYTVQWFNTLTGVYYGPQQTVTVSGGAYTIGSKPSNNDCILLMKRIK